MDRVGEVWGDEGWQEFKVFEAAEMTNQVSVPASLRIIAAFTCTVPAPGKASRNFKDFKIRELIKIVLGEFNGSGLILQMW